MSVAQGRTTKKLRCWRTKCCGPYFDTKEQQKQRDGKNAQIARSSDSASKWGGGRDIADYVDNPQTTLEGDTAGSSPHGAI